MDTKDAKSRSGAERAEIDLTTVPETPYAPGGLQPDFQPSESRPIDNDKTPVERNSGVILIGLLLFGLAGAAYLIKNRKSGKRRYASVTRKRNRR